MTNTTFPQTGWALWRSRESSRTQTTWSNRKCTIFLTFHLHKFTVLQFKWLYNYVSAFSKINIYQLNDIYTLQSASESARLRYKVKLQCTESATCPLELTSLPMQNLSTAPLSFRWPHFNFFLFIHHNAKTTRTCPHPFLLEKNLGASFSVGEESNNCVKYKEPGRTEEPASIFFFLILPSTFYLFLHKSAPELRHCHVPPSPRNGAFSSLGVSGAR